LFIVFDGTTAGRRRVKIYKTVTDITIDAGMAYESLEDGQRVPVPYQKAIQKIEMYKSETRRLYHYAGDSVTSRTYTYLAAAAFFVSGFLFARLIDVL